MLEGQSHRPDGLFYAGKEPEWSNRLFRRIVNEHLAAAKTIGFVDWHTGVGSFGEIVYLMFDEKGSAEHAAAARWWDREHGREVGVQVRIDAEISRAPVPIDPAGAARCTNCRGGGRVRNGRRLFDLPWRLPGSVGQVRRTRRSMRRGVPGSLQGHHVSDRSVLAAHGPERRPGHHGQADRRRRRLVTHEVQRPLHYFY